MKAIKLQDQIIALDSIEFISNVYSYDHTSVKFHIRFKSKHTQEYVFYVYNYNYTAVNEEFKQKINNIRNHLASLCNDMREISELDKKIDLKK